MQATQEFLLSSLIPWPGPSAREGTASQAAWHLIPPMGPCGPGHTLAGSCLQRLHLYPRYEAKEENL